MTFLIMRAEAANGEISALEMRQNCRGVEAAPLHGDNVIFNTTKYPDVFVCWGAFSVLHQESLYYDEASPDNPIFLRGVCSLTEGHGQRVVVLVKVLRSLPIM
ncbi:MAG: hypothetical protein WBF43_11375 [Methylocella sp.]